MKDEQAKQQADEAIEQSSAEQESFEQDYEQENEQSEKVVPVSESIRYRRRAQKAEKQNAELAKSLKEVSLRLDKATDELAGSKVERQLIGKLTNAGVRDIEAGVLIAKARISEHDGDIDGVIDSLKREKAYLFADGKKGQFSLPKTKSLKDEQRPQMGLAAAADRAAATGDRRDLQEYLQLRRSLL